MYRISSGLTNFNVKILPWVFLVFVIVFFVLYLISGFDFLIALTVLFSFYILIWWLNMRKLKNVYLGNKMLKVDNEILYFKDIISVKKYIFSSSYTIKYRKGKEIQSFKFLPKFYLPLFTHSYIKEIRNDIKERNNNLN